MRYVVVYERAPENWSAYSPDVPGCVAAGDSLEETRQLMQDALAEHLGLLLEDGELLPEASPLAAYVEVVDVEPRMPNREARVVAGK